jgi:hypothetical protein
MPYPQIKENGSDNFMSMRTKVTLVIMLIFIGVTAANYVSSITFTQKGMDESMENELSLALDIADNLVGTRIKLLKADAATIAERVAKANTVEEINEVLEKQIDEIMNFNTLTVYDRNGYLTSFGEPTPHQPGEYETELINRTFNSTSVICGPHYNEINGSFIMDVFASVGNDKVLSTTFSGMYFAEILSEYRLWQSGNIFMVDEQGTVVAHFSSDLVY